MNLRPAVSPCGETAALSLSYSPEESRGLQRPPLQELTLSKHLAPNARHQLGRERRGLAVHVFFLERARANPRAVHLFEQRLERRLIGHGADDEVRTVEDGGFGKKGSGSFHRGVTGLHDLLCDGEIGANDDVNVLLRNLREWLHKMLLVVDGDSNVLVKYTRAGFSGQARR